MTTCARRTSVFLELILPNILIKYKYFAHILTCITFNVTNGKLFDSWDQSTITKEHYTCNIDKKNSLLLAHFSPIVKSHMVTMGFSSNA